MLFFCFFKQKTAYELRISDWSSDVCSSDLSAARSCNPEPEEIRPHRKPGRARARRTTARSPYPPRNIPPPPDIRLRRDGGRARRVDASPPSRSDRSQDRKSVV